MARGRCGPPHRNRKATRDEPATRARWVAALGSLVALGLGCFAAPDPGGLRLVVSIQPLVLLVGELGGEHVSVSALVPPGASPHAFEPLPSDVTRLSRARSFLRVGGSLDAWTESLLAAAAGGLPTWTLLESEGLTLLSEARGESGRLDPHAWLDPLSVRDAIAPSLAAHLANLDPGGAARYEERLASFTTRLTELDREIRASLLQGSEPECAYVALHGAWRYFAARYGLEEIGIVYESGAEETTPRRIAALVDAARRARVHAILVESQLDPRVASMLAGEFGGRVVAVDPLGDPEFSDRATYTGLLRQVARGFTRACRRPSR